MVNIKETRMLPIKTCIYINENKLPLTVYVQPFFSAYFFKNAEKLPFFSKN